MNRRWRADAKEISLRDRHIWQKVNCITTSLSYGLVPNRDDARDFDEYRENPAFTEKGPELMQCAVRVLKKECFGEEIQVNRTKNYECCDMSV